MRVPFSRTFGVPITAPRDRMDAEKPWVRTTSMHPIPQPEAEPSTELDAEDQMAAAHKADREQWEATCAEHFERALDTLAPAIKPKGQDE